MDQPSFGVLGPLAVHVEGRPVAIGSRKQRMLLAALAMTPNQVVATDALVALLWGEEPPTSVEVTLRSLMSRIRQALGPTVSCVQARDGGYVLLVDPERIDAWTFEALTARGRNCLAESRGSEAAALLRQALALWRGPALAEITDRDAARPEAARLDQARAAAVEDLAAAELAAGQPDAALQCLEPHLARHPLRERAWGLRLLALYRLGRQADALAAYQRLRHTLDEELGVEPSPQLRLLQEQILRQDPALDASEPQESRLPTALTPLVGRAPQLAELAELLSNTRLLTLTGVGGVGKTRLALQLATDMAGRYRDGVRLVELAPVAESGKAASEVAAVLGVSSLGGPDELLERLGERLRTQETLLLLDNCEHVVADAALLGVALLRASPGLTVLATSREPLAVNGETVWSVPPLPIPSPGMTEVADLATTPAVELFCQRARAAQVGFGLTAENAAAVVDICRRLDGLPLALELAASRMRALGARQIAARLDDRFSLLTAGERTALPRHQTLRAALDWSYHLLAAAEQDALLDLTVFPASFDLAAAHAVIGPGRPPDLIFRLVDKSMVVTRRRGGDIRYELLETVRSYAAERVAEIGGVAAAARRHREHFTSLVTGERERSGNWDSLSWIRIVAAEEGNLRAAIASALAVGETDTALRIACGLWTYWMWAGRSEPLDWVEQALDLPGVDIVARCQATTALAAFTIWWELGSPERSAQLFTEAYALAGRADDDCRARVRHFHGEFLALRGERQSARATFDDALRFAGIGGGWTHHALGWLAVADSDLARAQLEFERAAEQGRSNEPTLAHALAASAVLAAVDGESIRAAELAERAVAEAARMPLPGVMVVALARAAQTHLLGGDLAATHRAVNSLFEMLHRHGIRQFRAEAFEMAAVLAEHAGDHADAARSLGACQAVRQGRTEERIGVDLLGSLLRGVQERAIAALGEPQYRAALAAGASTPAADLVAEIAGACCPRG